MLPDNFNKSAVARGIKAVGVGRKGSKPVSKDLSEEILIELKEKEISQSSIGAFFGALLIKGVTEEEVAKAVQRLQDSAIYARDSYRTPARVLGGALAIGRTVDDVESWPKRIGMVTADAVNRAIAVVLKDSKSVTALLLPKPTT